MTRSARALTAGFLFVAIGIASGQDPHPSHIPVPRKSASDPARVFQESIQKSRLRADLDSIIKQLGPGGAISNPDQVRRLLDSNPQLMELLQGLQSNDPQSRDRLRKLLGDSNTRNRAPATQALERELRRLAQNAQGGNSARELPQTQPGNSGIRQRRSETSTTSGESSVAVESSELKSQRQWANTIAEWAERLPRQKMGGLRDSQAMQDLVRQFSESAAKAVSGGDENNLAAQLARWESRIQGARDWLPHEIPELFRPVKSWDLSGLPRPNLPNVDFSPRALPSAPSFQFSSGDLGVVANVLLVGLALAVVAAAIWKIRRTAMSPEAKARRALGPWPIDPGSVSTREDVIRAFEYLSLLRCGEPARTWHHHAIAERLGNSDAHLLAELYEQARYAPSQQREPDWTSARAPLTALAGV